MQRQYEVGLFNNKSVNYILKIKNEKVLISKLIDYSIAKENATEMLGLMI